MNNVSFLQEYDIDFHVQNTQYIRFMRACSKDKIGKVISINRKKQTMKIRSSEPGNRRCYKVCLWRCECPDFSKNGTPCKHMYKLALELGLIDKNFISSYVPNTHQYDAIRRVVNIPAKKPAGSKKSKTTALVACVLASYLGAHYYYVGRWGMGLLYTCTIGLCGIGWVVDILRILLGKFHDKQGLALK